MPAAVKAAAVEQWRSRRRSISDLLTDAVVQHPAAIGDESLYRFRQVREQSQLALTMVKLNLELDSLARLDELAQRVGASRSEAVTLLLIEVLGVDLS